MDKKTCHYCNAEFTKGRRDKKYCNAHCRSAFQYQTDVKNEPFYHHVKKKLSKNRLILKTYNKSGLAKTRLSELVHKGFDPRYSTHSWMNGKGDKYMFVFEFGFLVKVENNVKKVVLIIWQEYMNKN